MRGSTKRLEERLEVRLTPKAKSILERAASVEHKTVSAFMVEKGLAAAAETLAGRTEFRLSYQRDPVEQKLRDKLMFSLREAISPDDLSRLMKEGEALSDEDGARLALRD
jgi:uncharacterized protein (DUF1778 family)